MNPELSCTDGRCPILRLHFYVLICQCLLIMGVFFFFCWLILNFFRFYFWGINFCLLFCFGLLVASGKAAEFGALKDGYMFECTTGLSRMYGFYFIICPCLMLSVNISWHQSLCVVCRLLSSPTCPVLDALGKKLSFEIAVGLNGRVWVYAWHLYFQCAEFCSSLLLVSLEALYAWPSFISWAREFFFFFILLISAFFSKLLFLLG